MPPARQASVVRPPVLSPPAAARAKRSALLRIGGLVFVLIAATIVAQRLGWFNYRHTLQHIERIRQTHSFGTFAVGFVLVYGAVAAIGMPALPLTVVGGVLFGAFLGTVLSWCGAMIAAVIGYWTARSIARDVVLRWMKRYKRADTAVADARDFTGLLQLRLLPVLPLGMVNFVAGLARAPFVPYMAATAVGVLPALLIYNYFADSLLERVGGGRSAALISLVASSALLIVLTLLPKAYKRKAQRRDREQ